MTSAITHLNGPRADDIAEVLRTHYWSWSFYRSQEHPAMLLQLLLEKLPHIPAHSWPARFEFGGIYVNGKEALTDQALPTPCRIEYYEPKFDISNAPSIFPEFKSEYVLYRDEHILVAYKPPGLSSMPAKEQRHYSLKASIEKFVGSPIHMPSRLDVSARGLIITSISQAAHGALQRAFELRRVSKAYLCATHVPPSWNECDVNRPIGRDPIHPVLRTTLAVNGQSALTTFHSLGECMSGEVHVHALLAQPLTGRTHQIRVHAASEGIPLVGDRFYGGAPAPYLHLVSYALECRHPIDGNLRVFHLPPSLLPDWSLAVSTRLERHHKSDHTSLE